MPKISAKSKLLKQKKNAKKNNQKRNKQNEEKQPKEFESNEDEKLSQQQEDIQAMEVERDHEEQAKHNDTDLAHLLQPIQAHDLKNGVWCIDEKSGFPGQVSQIKRSAPGKHGHAKFNYKLVSPFNGKTSNPMHAASDQLYRAVMSKRDYLFVDMLDDAQTVMRCQEMGGIK
eukprot:CAMPEP_0197021110 /NCGR_PEP_ID=MMETSP1384-20130603/2018_1 /TAXON_ID=29189 /ORGANISM="Ammonia sp." /LENGTH=171 /DNA_ID=CAMNT_0042448871 /DNA_START=63 /DNA_END=575 /DNA_ORIENTATION=+